MPNLKWIDMLLQNPTAYSGFRCAKKSIASLQSHWTILQSLIFVQDKMAVSFLPIK